MPHFDLTSIAFQDGQPIPRQYSCEGDNASPPMDWSAPPEGTQSLALIVHDPDAPDADFTHWLAWGIDPLDGGLDEGAHPPNEGTNGFGENGYDGPCPPPGDGAHRYESGAARGRDGGTRARWCRAHGDLRTELTTATSRRAGSA